MKIDFLAKCYAKIAHKLHQPCFLLGFYSHSCLCLFQVNCSVVLVQVLQSVAFLKVLFWSLPDYIVFFFLPYLFTQAVCGMSIGLVITVIGKRRDQVSPLYRVGRRWHLCGGQTLAFWAFHCRPDWGLWL